MWPVGSISCVGCVVMQVYKSLSCSSKMNKLHFPCWIFFLLALVLMWVLLSCLLFHWHSSASWLWPLANICLALFTKRSLFWWLNTRASYTNTSPQMVMRSTVWPGYKQLFMVCLQGFRSIIAALVINWNPGGNGQSLAIHKLIKGGNLVNLTPEQGMAHRKTDRSLMVA